ncbi:protein of unknown function [Pedobacter steynii]|uniref:DUF4302 domain-containing protein n=1 Tax=Pedobacter steynii TaxID=430522 RepID=A0A1G9RKF2_9SPHI|nr:DUF4302 domain-containing protein [Pedobacter steynii]NQX37749.1 DUF4302 domain-containing protein [Pedobacter steynii]SDM22895.1 protein of unknown function [Pedobacter steynii]
MKRILFFIALLSVLISCKKTSYVAKFDKLPQERAGEQIALVLNSLTSAKDGWIGSLPTAKGGGYGFYISFDKDQNVIMYGDLTDKSAAEAGKSYFRVKQDMGTDLIFDTYNYISMLNDPDDGVLGGESKIGFSSDIEFIYDHATADSIIFIGKKFRQPFKLVKATAAQKAVYEAGGYKTAIDKFKNFFITNQNPYIELGSGAEARKIGITPNTTNNLDIGKRIDFTGPGADGKISSASEKFNFTLDGLSILNNGLVFQGITFVRLNWKDATTLAMYDAAGKEYIVKNSIVPLIPLSQLWGTKYSGMLSEFKTIYPGTSASGAVILNYFHNNLQPNPLNPYSFNYGRINFVWSVVNKRLTINAHTSQSGGASTWVTSSSYSYTTDDKGVYKFTLLSPPSEGYAGKIILKLHDFILANHVTFDYYIDNGVVYGKMASVEDPTIVMTFMLQ